MADQTYRNFLLDPDQTSRRAELATFFGPHADKFLKAYDAQVVAANRAPGEKIKFQWFSGSYVWPAFFIGPVWFFYRKMWAWGVGITVVVLLIGLLPITSRLGFPLGVALALSGPMFYLGHAVKKIEELRGQSAGGVIDPARLAAVGGVSKAAGWIGGIVYGLMVALTIYGIIALGTAGTPMR